MDRLVLLKANTSSNFLKVIWKLRKVSRKSCLWNSKEIPAIMSPVEFFFIEAGSNMLPMLQSSCSKKLFKKLSVFPLTISSVNVTRKLRIWSHLLKKSMENFIFVCSECTYKGLYHGCFRKFPNIFGAAISFETLMDRCFRKFVCSECT